MHDYDELHDATLIEATGIGEFPTALIRAHIALGLTTVQEELGPWGNATVAGPDTTCIVMDVDDLSWPVLMLAALNVDVHHAAPKELRTLLHQLSARIGAMNPDPHRTVSSDHSEPEPLDPVHSLRVPR